MLRDGWQQPQADNLPESSLNTTCRLRRSLVNAVMSRSSAVRRMLFDTTDTQKSSSLIGYRSHHQSTVTTSSLTHRRLDHLASALDRQTFARTPDRMTFAHTPDRMTFASTPDRRRSQLPGITQSIHTGRSIISGRALMRSDRAGDAQPHAANQV